MPTLTLELASASPPNPLRRLVRLSYNPYAHAGPSSYALAPPSPPLCLLAPATCGVPSRHASDATYHPYAHEVPSQHASNAAYHP
ncbi:hypothetical protein O181_115050 [Austropuccinia psidii MF-1]|uniref:Uncharacterized protein n=1 Tax=Austropuccinia psidii MF-1 TaxID=1389203 RepID=A0A9Q3K9M7_9BASI|nr:hypothetical protein [Austropuccinia psidii MF-1]